MINGHKLYGDEIKMPLFGSDGRKCVRHKAGEMLHPDYIQATMKYPHSVVICSCISTDYIGHLHIINGVLNVPKRIGTILEPKILLFIRDLFTNNASFLFQQDSAYCPSVK
ncbi:transposable element Tcb1 transposase [Trichonephila clavipes]|nr:transposable element Tcb1 transposase [Trichonephila clavipes]